MQFNSNTQLHIDTRLQMQRQCLGHQSCQPVQSIMLSCNHSCQLHAVIYTGCGHTNVKLLQPTCSMVCADPVTAAWMGSHIDKVFGYPELVRFSWQTTTRLLEEHAAPVRWYAAMLVCSRMQYVNCTESQPAMSDCMLAAAAWWQVRRPHL